MSKRHVVGDLTPSLGDHVEISFSTEHGIIERAWKDAAGQARVRVRLFDDEENLRDRLVMCKASEVAVIPRLIERAGDISTIRSSWSAKEREERQVVKSVPVDLMTWR